MIELCYNKQVFCNDEKEEYIIDVRREKTVGASLYTDIMEGCFGVTRIIGVNGVIECTCNDK